MKLKSNLQTNEKIVVTIAPENQKPMSFKPKIISVTPSQQFRWLGRVLMPGIFDGEHQFILKKISDNETLFVHKENFSGILSNLVIKKIGASTEAGFIAMNKALKERCE